MERSRLMTNNFWHDLPKPFFILAPMEDVTDIAFRQVVAKAARPDVFFTEFTNVEAFNHPKGRQSVQRRLAYADSEQPIVAHIWGEEAENFAKMSKAMAAADFAGMDLNMGCPVKNVVSQGRGSGLIREPQKASGLIQATKAGGLPVSVKTRLGFYKIEEMYEWIPHLLQEDIVNLTIHLRSRKEMSDYPAHYEVIPEILKMRDDLAPNTLITINGDIEDRQEGLALVEKYPGIDGIMIGRGVFHNIFAFEEVPQEHVPEEFLNLFRYHLDLFDANQDVLHKPLKELRRSYKIYTRGLPHASKLRQELMTVNTSDEVRTILDIFERDYL